uniref:Uncharacterized protein n=1 Tax=Setaria italica TaxID=4555 RepID=K4ANJ7_SETIT
MKKGLRQYAEYLGHFNGCCVLLTATVIQRNSRWALLFVICLDVGLDQCQYVWCSNHHAVHSCVFSFFLKKIMSVKC